MLRIFEFLYRLRSFLLFISLELVALWMIIRHNSPQGAAFFNSSMGVSGAVLNAESAISDYFLLAEKNKELAKQNADLLEQLLQIPSSSNLANSAPPTSEPVQFQVMNARVISQSIRFSQNHLTINRGSQHGVKEGMGIISASGAVGRIKAVSKNYSVGISLLNTELLVSSKIKSTEVFGTVNWDGKSSREAKMLYIPRHAKVSTGDSILTSGYNAVFPEGVYVGTVTAVHESPTQNYLDITLEFGVDFSKINEVYLVENLQAEELDSLYQEANRINVQ